MQQRGSHDPQPHYLRRFHAAEYTRAGMWLRATTVPRDIARYAASTLDLTLSLWERDVERGLDGPFSKEQLNVPGQPPTVDRGSVREPVEFTIIANRRAIFAGSGELGGVVIYRRNFQLSRALLPTQTHPELRWRERPAMPRAPATPLDWLVVWSGVLLVLRVAEEHESRVAGLRSRSDLKELGSRGRGAVPIHQHRNGLEAMLEWCGDSERAMLSWLATGT